MDRFSTERLSAERLDDSHLADLVALHLDPDVSRYLGGIRSPDTTKTYLATNIAHWQKHGFGLWVLKTGTGEFAGRAGVRYVQVDDVEEVEIAYTFKRGMWGRGLATEISAALIRIALFDLKLPSLVGLVFVGNTASRRVLEKSGFALERNVIFQEGKSLPKRPARYLPARCRTCYPRSWSSNGTARSPKSCSKAFARHSRPGTQSSSKMILLSSPRGKVGRAMRTSR